MPKRSTHMYHVDRHALARLAQDGFGWGHDPPNGSFIVAGLTPRAGMFARIIRRSKKETVK